MFRICLADSRNALHGLLVTHVTAQSVAGVGRIDDHPTFADNGHCLTNQSLLRIVGVNLEKTGSLLTPET